MSASSMPTFNPMPLKPSARLTAVVDLPTPPLPDATAMMALTPSGAWAERVCAPARPRVAGAAAAGPRPAARSAVSATMAEVTPGKPRTASSAALRTPSQRWTSAASTLIEKNTFPSLTTMSESVPVAGSGVPSGDFTAESRSNTASLVAGIALLHSPAAARTARAGQHRTLARSVNVAMHRIRRAAAGRASQVQHHCVACDQHAAGAHFFDLRQHGRVHVGDHDLARGERGEFFAELRPVHVAVEGAPDWCTTSTVWTESPRNSAGAPGTISTTRHGYRQAIVVDRGKKISSAASRRSRVPGGPAMRSGRVRRLRKWPSITRKMTPPKWSPCRWLSRTPSIALGSTPRALRAGSEEAPQSSSRSRPNVSMRKQVLKRPPEPNASPEPMTVIFMPWRSDAP